MQLFRAYDIRGTTPQPLNAEVARRIGRAVARVTGAKALAVGRDARASSPQLCAALIAGIRAEGCAVLDIGLTATPVLYYAVCALGAGGGVMVTASHNPAEYNGFKVCREQAIPVGGESGLAEIQAEAEALENAAEKPARPRGAYEKCAVLPGYLEHVQAVARPPSGRRARAVVDCGNGMAAVALERLLPQLPLQVSKLFFEPDGTFPNHPADPTQPENLRALRAAVVEQGADFGVAFDGDADRAVFVDEKGAPVPGDLTAALLARALLKNAGAEGGTVLCDLRSSRAAFEAVEEAGGRALRCRVGHSYVKAAMRREGALFAGELSGHYYFRFPNGLIADDGIAAFLAFCDVFAEQGKPLSQMVAPLRRYSASGEISRDVGARERMQQIMQAVAAEHQGAPELSWLDGLLVAYEDWWFNLRPSNTEPLLRLNLEARTPEKMARERDQLLARMRP